MKITSADGLDCVEHGGAVASTTAERARESALGSTSDALWLVLRGRKLDLFESQLLEVPHHDIFRPREDLRASERCALAYRRMRYLQKELGLRSADLLANAQHLLALHGWTGLIDGPLTTLLTIHYNLCIGSKVTQGEGRAALVPLLDELESMHSSGVFLATELAHGNNVQALETEAVYDPAERSFVFHTGQLEPPRERDLCQIFRRETREDPQAP